MAIVERTPDEALDWTATLSVATCAVCTDLLPKGFPLWGAHLNAAFMLHEAHRLVQDLADVPGVTDEDRRFGRRLVLGTR